MLTWPNKGVLPYYNVGNQQYRFYFDYVSGYPTGTVTRDYVYWQIRLDKMYDDIAGGSNAATWF